jgi:hypothetical protein
MLSKRQITSFLSLGYFLDFENINITLQKNNFLIDESYKHLEYKELLSVGKDLFLSTIENLYRPNEVNIVPISGGLDSRAILAGLLEFTEARNIKTYTFGNPGTLDYEIGNLLANKVGTVHTKVPLDNYELTIDELIQVSNKVSYQTYLFYQVPLKKVSELLLEGNIWSGFMGDPLAGSHLKENPATNLFDAKISFLKSNVMSNSLFSFEEIKDTLVSEIQFNDIGPTNLTIEETLDFYNRQLKLVAPHVLINGYNYSLPFLDNNWVRFITNIDRKYRFNQIYYKDLLLYSFPKIFNYPTKTYHGEGLNNRKIQGSIKKGYYRIKHILSKFNSNLNSPYLNYTNFHLKFLNNKELNHIIKLLLRDFSKRNLIDENKINNIIKNFEEDKLPDVQIIILICSLEIHLKSINNKW